MSDLTFDVYEVLNIVDEEAISVSAEESKSLRDMIYDHDIIATVDASHAGLPTRKFTIYVPSRIRESVDSWLPKKLSNMIETHPLPVLLSHDSKSNEIVGYVFNAEYVEDPELVFDPLEYTDEKVVKRVPILNGPEKVGFIRIYHVISDYYAKELFISGKLGTVSIGGTSTERYCSICGANVFEGGCEHIQGYLYNGRNAYHFIGKMNYHHLAYASIPADMYTKYIDFKMVPKDKLELAKIKTTVVIPYNKINNINYAITNYESIDNVAGIDTSIIDKFSDIIGRNATMANDDIDRTEYTDEDLILYKVLNDRVDKILEGINLADKKLTSKDRKRLPDSVFCGPNRSFPVPDCTHYRVALAYLHKYKGPGNKEKIRACILRRGRKLGCGGQAAKGKTKDELDEALEKFFAQQDESFFTYEESTNTDNTKQATNNDECKECDDWIDTTDYTEDELKVYEYLNEKLPVLLNAVGVEDKVLKASERKKLPASVFCGPNKTFPVPDCKHYRAALLLLGRYKGPGNKAKIRACIERRGKMLGCTKKEEDSAEEVLKFIEKINEFLDSQPDTFFGVAVEDTSKEDTHTEANAEDNELNKRIKELEDEVSTLRKKIDYYKHELDVAEETARSYYEEIADYENKYKEMLAESVIMYRLMLSMDDIREVDDYDEWYRNVKTEWMSKRKDYLLGTLDTLRTEFVKNFPSLKPYDIKDEGKDDKDITDDNKKDVNIKHIRLKQLLEDNLKDNLE